MAIRPNDVERRVRFASVRDHSRAAFAVLLVSAAALLIASTASPVFALPKRVERVADPVRWRLPDPGPNPGQAAREVVGGAVDHTQDVVGHALGGAGPVANAAGDAANGVANEIVDAVAPDDDGAGRTADAARPATHGDHPATAEASTQSDPQADADGDAVGGGNDVRPSPGSGGPPPDDLCQGSPLCLGILFADGNSSAGSRDGFPGTLPLTGLDAAAGLLIAALLGLTGALLLSPDALGRGRGGPQPAPAWAASRPPGAGPSLTGCVHAHGSGTSGAC